MSEYPTPLTYDPDAKVKSRAERCRVTLESNRSYGLARFDHMTPPEARVLAAALLAAADEAEDRREPTTRGEA